MRISDWSSDVCSSDLGDIVFAADGGTITAGSYFVVADGITASATGTGGVADGGTIDLLASNGGLIEATDTAVSSSFSASAQSGTSAGGTGATDRKSTRLNSSH